MFSSVAITSYFLCVKSDGPNCCSSDVKTNVKVACGADIITGIALLIIGCLSISGIIPCSAIGGGFMIGIGCLQLIAAPVVTLGNCCLTSMWDAM